MNKKLLTALIAFSMVGAFGCVEEPDNNSGNGGTQSGPCVTGAKQCNGNMPQLCVNGAWLNGTDCGSVGCNIATGQCNTAGGTTPTACTTGAKQCNGTIPQTCVNGAWVNGTDCGTNGCSNGVCNSGSTNPGTGSGEACTKDTYTPSCSADKLNGYYCGGQGTVVTVSCPNANCVNNNGYIKCDDGNSGGTGSGEACTKDTYTPSCSADKLNGYYCGSKGTVVTVSCPDANCVNNNGYIKCDDGNSGSGNTGTGEACVKADYTPSCSADKLNGYYCGSKGTVVTVSCPDANCVNNDGYIKCDDGNSGGTGSNAPCAPGGTVYCQKVCNAAKTEGYYYSKGEVHTVSCPNADCNISNNNVVCGSGNSGNSGSNSDEACTKDTYTPSCSADKTKGYYCGNKGTVYTLSCPNANCVNNNGYIKCDDGNSGGSENLTNCSTTEGASCTKCQNVCDGLNGYYCDTKAGVIRKKTCSSSCAVVSNSVKCDGTCNGTTVTTGGKPGDCCDQSVYKPTGCDTGLRCNSSGVVTKWSCYNGETCTYDANDTTYPGGTFDCK